MPKFKIEQLAINPKNPGQAKVLLAAMGFDDWVNDHVVAAGHVKGAPGSNEADLSFNYGIFPGEFEVLDYTTGPNWVDEIEGANVSHIGMHCTEEELAEWKVVFGQFYIQIAQEVWTESHTNEAIKGKRSYHYCIFDTRDILGCDVKFIVRKDLGEAQLELAL